jgi:hypothetical protein
MSGIVIIGYTTDCYLMIDADNKRSEEVVDWAKKLTKESKLGSVIIMKTSDCGQNDLDGNKLQNYAIIFGEQLPFQEIKQYVEKAYKDGIVDKKFWKMRFQGITTERVDRKSVSISHPKIFKYIPNGTNEGCFDYLRWWTWFRNINES